MKHQVRIGIFVNDLLSPYQIRLFNSIKRAANARGVRVIGFQGSFLVQPGKEDSTAFDGSFVYGLAGEESVDGLVIVSGVLSSRAGINAVSDLCKKSKLPLVSIGRLPGVTSIEAGCHDALRLVVNHLVGQHARRKVVLIEGPKENPDSIERGRIVKDTLQELGVSIPESHVVNGDFLESSGASAIRLLFDQRGVSPRDVDSIIALNDQMAVGAINELASRRIRVPDEVAVVGFDDDDFARASNPPLTTISQPIELIGERAINLIMAQTNGESVADHIVLEAEPIWRRSCGCEIPHVSRYITVIPGETGSGTLDTCKKACYERYERMAGLLADARVIETAVRAIDAVDETGVNHCLQELESDILRAFDNGIDPLRWHDVLSPVSDFISRNAISDGSVGRRRARRLRVVDLLINEVAARVRALDHLHTMQWAHAARVLSTALLSVRHVQYLTSVLNAGLPSLGINYCCVCLFVGNDEPRNAKIAALYSPTLPPPPESPRSPEELWLAAPGSIPPEQPESLPSIFPAFELIHPELRNSDANARLDLSVYPLVYAHSTLGYVVFDAPSDAHQAWLLEGLAGSLSSAVYAISRNTELRDARDKAERANAAKSEFVAMITHEVRTPLTAVMGHIDLCLQTELLNNQQRHLNQAQTSLGSLVGIVNDILDFSKVEAQRIEIESEPFALDEVLDQVVATSSQSALRKGLLLVVDVDPEIPHWIRGDALRLGQVLLNLVGNAIKFSTYGTIRLNAYRAPSERTEELRLRFQVTDDGIGMSQEQIDRIFDPFTQADGSMTRKYGGTGLGLTISRKLVGLMNGEIHVDSAPDKGSQFTFTVGFKPCEYPIEPLVQGGGKRILVVEENPLVRRSIENLLTSYGFSSTTKPSIEMGLAALKQPEAGEPFDMMIADVDASREDPVAFWRSTALTIESVGCQLLLISSNEDDPRMFDLTAGLPILSAVIQKPFQRRYLTQVIARSLSPQIANRPSTAVGVSLKVPKNARILVIQDEPTTGYVISEILTQAGARVRIATTGEAAIKLVRKQAFDLIFQDLHLPGMDGFDTAKAIRSLDWGRSVPILALSASSMQYHVEECRAAGIDDYVKVPFDADTLIRTVRRWIAKDDAAAAVHTVSDGALLSGDATSNLLDLDTASALERLSGDVSLYKKLLMRFHETYGSNMATLQEALEKRNIQGALLYAHTMASSSANIGASLVLASVQAIEEALHQENVVDALEIFTDLEIAAQRCGLAVGQYLATKGAHAPDVSTAVGWAQIAERLRTCIVQNDSAALDLLQELKATLRPGVLTGPTFQRLAAGLSAYDFEEAAGHLDALIARMEQLEAE